MQQNIMDVRNMPEIQAIAEYLRSMTFKRKAFGGADPENVLDHFTNVTLQYEAVVSACLTQIDEQVRQITELGAGKMQLVRENAEWQKYCRDLAQWHEVSVTQLRAHNDQMNQQLMTPWTELDLQRRSNYVSG